MDQVLPGHSAKVVNSTRLERVPRRSHGAHAVCVRQRVGAGHDGRRAV